MTKEKAKNILNDYYRNKNYNSTNKDEVELANAINVILPNYSELDKRDTPMKVKAWSGRCPNCGGPEVRNSGFDFCQECGQRLDWEELENDK